MLILPDQSKLSRYVCPVQILEPKYTAFRVVDNASLSDNKIPRLIIDDLFAAIPKPNSLCVVTLTISAAVITKIKLGSNDKLVTFTELPELVAGVIEPTSGKILRHGRVTALLELGTGFNPELSGYENIFLNGSILLSSTSWPILL